MHCLPVPEEDSKHFSPWHLGTGVAKGNTQQLSTGWNNALLTQRRDRARSAPIVGIGPSWLAALPGQMASVYPSHTTVENPNPSAMESDILKAGGFLIAIDIHA